MNDFFYNIKTTVAPAIIPPTLGEPEYAIRPKLLFFQIFQYHKIQQDHHKDWG